MPGANFSGPNLATVAYAEVAGADGSSTTCNSGVSTTRISAGLYNVILPTNLAQNQNRDLIFVQPKGPYGTTQLGGALVAKNAEVDDSDPITKAIAIFDGNPALGASTRIDSDFSILILRTTITPPAGAPA